MTRATEAKRVFDEVVSEILTGALSPREALSERDLVSRFGVSRTPVREALKRLFERGLLEPGPKGVAIVAEISAQDLRQLYALRLELEGWAAQIIASNITRHEIDSLRALNKEFGAALRSRDLARMFEARASFHHVAVQATHNRWLAEILTMLRDRAFIARLLHWREVDRAIQTLRIQEKMITALQHGDAETYRKLVLEHIQSALDSYEKQLRVPSLVRKEPGVLHGRGRVLS